MNISAAKQAFGLIAWCGRQRSGAENETGRAKKTILGDENTMR